MKWIFFLDPDLPPAADGPFIEPEEPPLLMDARELWRQFHDNQVAAELRFGSVGFVVEGTIDHVDRDERGRIRVHFEVSRYHTLRVRFPEEARDEVAELRPGDRVMVHGRVAEVDSGVVVVGAVPR